MTFYKIAVAAVLACASLDGLYVVLLPLAVAFHAARSRCISNLGMMTRHCGNIR